MRSKPKILFLGTQIAVGGAQSMMLSQTAWFYEQGYPVTAAFFYDKHNLHEKWQAENQFPILNFNGWRYGGSTLSNAWRLVGALWRFYRFLLDNNITAIETFTPHSDLIGLPVAWLAGVPVRVGCYQGIIHIMPSWQAWLHARLINTRVVTGFVGVSRQMVELAVKAGIQSDKIVMIPNAVNVLEPEIEVELRSHREKIRRELCVPDGGVLTITSARLDREKGHIYLLQAIHQVVESYPKVIFAFAGDGYLRPDLEKQAEDLGILKHVRFLGNRFDMPALMRAADIFILPSLAEGLSLALLEAMTAGLPVVATKVQGSSDVIFHGQSGFLVPPADSGALKDAIIQCLQKPQNWDSLGQHGRDTILANYTIERICQRYEAYFQELIDSSQKDQL